MLQLQIKRTSSSGPDNPSDKGDMAFDPLVANPNRLRILTALAVDEQQEFVQLRRTTEMTDGNLACHARRLQSGGLIAIDKQLRSGKPVTQFTLTPAGRKALETHARRLFAAISHRRISSETAPSPVPLATPVGPEDDWVD
jgi:DNA-binding MarR family transcriptional regulator